nr:MAG TPA: hypothetical protein [Caudoviricetes sp.]
MQTSHIFHGFTSLTSLRAPVLVVDTQQVISRTSKHPRH